MFKINLFFHLNFSKLNYLKKTDHKKWYTDYFTFFLFLWIIKKYFKHKNCNFYTSIKKQYSTPIVLLKSAFKHKIPKHILKRIKHKIIATFVFNLKNKNSLFVNYSGSFKDINIIKQIPEFILKSYNITYIQLYRIQYEMNIKIDESKIKYL